MDEMPASPTASESSKSNSITAVFSKSRNRNSTSFSMRSGASEGSHGFRASLEGAMDKLKRDSDSDEADGHGSNSLKRFVPKGFESKKKRLQREEEERRLEEVARGRDVAERGTLENETRKPIDRNMSDRSTSSLLTYDSETETAAEPSPPLTTHLSHTGYLTSSSPLIHTSTIPQIRPQPSHLEGDPFPDSTDSLAASQSSASTSLSRNLRAPIDGSQRRPSSPVGRLKEVFKPRRGPGTNTSPERKAGGGGADQSLNTQDGGADSRRGSVTTAKVASVFSDKQQSLNKPRSTTSSPERPSAGKTKLTTIDTNQRPRTPPSGNRPAPVIVNTPPTPTDTRSPQFTSAPSSASPSGPTSDVLISPSGKMISHRRIRSGSTSGVPSKLSNIQSAPLTPTPENGAITPGQGQSGFFSSVFSAAQNAANTLSNSITNTSVPGGTRNRSGVQTISDIQEIETLEVEALGDKIDPDNLMEEKEPAVKTLGMGDLSLSQLGISEEGNTPTMPKHLEESRGKFDPAKDDHFFANRSATAPNMLTGENLEAVATPQIEDLQVLARPRSAYESSVIGDRTPPNGSVFEGKSGIHRSGSVRSAINNRKRGSSAGTGAAIGAAIAAAHSSIGSPGSGGAPKITGFAVASKKRNRDFHALFRSVPDDDYLIEDYSCALQREILAHGRLYVSEGHLCFSSNIFGWVTTLVMSFDEIISVEKRSTALLFKNGLMISTLHAKNVFASFTSRDSTYDLIVGIWKIGHPNLRSSLNGVTLEETGGGDKTEKDDGMIPSHPGSISQSSDDSEASGDVYDEDEDDEDGMSFTQADGSVLGSESGERIVSRKASAAAVTSGAQTEGGKLPMPTVAADFPGPSTHAATCCSDGDTHYAKVLADETIPAPLGKVFSLMFGPASITWMRDWLTNDQKCLELNYEENAKAPLSLENKVRNYSYIKPLNASIGPKQTKCVSTETLDALDFEKAVSVTISTVTPDVPSGNVFSTKTRYCLSWSEGNGTRLQVNCAIEWTGKSWLKTPIEKGANDGQVQYTKDIIAALKAAVGTRRSGGPGAVGKGKKKGRKGSKANNLGKVTDGASETKPEEANWGLFEPVRGIFEPILDIVQPLMTGNILYGLLVGLLVASWFRFGFPLAGGGNRDMGMNYLGTPERIAAYEEIWRREESELWLWLEERAGMDRLREVGRMPIERLAVEDRLKSEGMGEREIEDAIRVTEERLMVLKDVVGKKRGKSQAQAKEQEPAKQRQRRRTLRRTHIEAASAGISPPPPRVKFAQRQPSAGDFTHDFEDEPDTEPHPLSEHPSPEGGKRYSRPPRVDKHTASAILYTLEEALRRPNPFTPDYIEENASMSDLLGGATSSANNGARPAASGSPHIRGPRDIMRDRQAREARKASEASEQKARAAEQKRNEEELIRQAERRIVAGAAAQRLEERSDGQRISGNSQRVDRRAGDRTTTGGASIRPVEQPVQRRATTTRVPSGPEVAPLRLSMRAQSKPAEAGGPSQPGLPTGAGPAQPAPLNVPAREGPTRSSFPHAFERWETLSAHWEGLTSFWLRRLEENSSEINRDPLSQQLSRQNTDLSAAGANLFHAVVELQRLRASSERKFQRWFFETREQEERATENLAVMAKQLEDERNSRTQAIKEAVESERRKNQSDKVIAELKRELEIARSEARRAWDELGRRETEERERTMSLRDGQPTVLGGVQVVPMIQGVPSRHGSTAARDLPPTRQGGPSDSGSGSARTGGRFADPESPTGSNEAYQQYQRSQRPEPSDPFIECIRQRQAAAATSAPSSSAGPQYTQAPAVQPASPSTNYEQAAGRPAPSAQAGRGEGQYAGSNSEDEYEIDEQGNFVLDAAGNRIRYSSVVSDDDTAEYEHSPRQYRHGRAPITGPPIPMSGVEYGQGPANSTAGNPASTTASPVDYSGSGYGAGGAGAGWESFPRHHHPTRLSDVLEEDERSRTSASQVSRRE
ncbi:hypothetical protein DSL72_001907 [Monilinia vaccinii-corymbosi]|uniref:VASt domain-containing protein n=1 Tax=Monilinia vaccinii-corymbosi TaxID=61207 RepID=A0A8A3PB58_9HELO|nr:hypothetical protein DSL72_001907 [Monilinia vaccinii-corymbosi]